VHDILASPPENWSLERRKEYLLWTERVVAGLRGVDARLESRYDELLASGKRSLGIS
jgi:GTP diphosphokinase / guanosine-3',5'-bis(diphosphate) 3'-diphosphatase